MSLRNITIVIFLFFALRIASETLLVANKSSCSVSFIDYKSMTEKLALKICSRADEQPHEIAVSPDGTLALVSHYGKVSLDLGKAEFNNLANAGSKLSVIDVAHGKLLQQIDLPKKSSPHGIRFLTNTKALVSAEGLQSLLVVDIIDHDKYQVWFLPLPGKGAHVLALDSKKDFVYIANKDSGSIVKFDLHEHKVVSELVIGKHAEGIAVTHDDAHVLVTDRLSSMLTIVDAKTMSIHQKIETEKGPIRITMLDDGKSALITNALAGTAQELDLTSLKIAKGFITTNKFNFTTGRWWASIFGYLKVPVNAVIARDQTSVFVANSYAGNITLIDIKTGHIKNTFQAGNEPDGMALSQIDTQILSRDE